MAGLTGPDSILVLNAGSTSLKLRLVGSDDATEDVPSLESLDAGRLQAVGHRVVHGGARFRDPVVIDDTVRRGLQGLVPLAPLHNAPAVTAIDRARSTYSGVPHVAVFDTAFHATIPEVNATYAVPRRWAEEWGLRRFGFHGLSVAWSVERASLMTGRERDGLRLVVCHLGGGCSVTAVVDGRSVDTTMGFTPLEGLAMSTRSGSVDPGALIYLLRERGLSADELDLAHNQESGLKGLTGGSGDLRDVRAAAMAGDGRARLALDVYVHRIATAVGAMSISSDGLDALVFTGGVGERSAWVRAEVCARLGSLGVLLDTAANELCVEDSDIAAANGAVRVLVIAAREELMIARATRDLLLEQRG